MNPGSILHDPQFRCHDNTIQDKLLVVLNDGSVGKYILVKTTSSNKKKGSSPGCNARDNFRNFFIPKGQSNFPIDTWVMLNEFYEARRHELLQRSMSGYIKVKGELSENLIKSLLVCAKDSQDITPDQEAILDDTLNKLVLNMSLESNTQPVKPETAPSAPAPTTPKALCPFCFEAMVIEGKAWRCRQVNKKGEEHGIFPACPKCNNPLKPGVPHWCAWCRMWFDKELNRI